MNSDQWNGLSKCRNPCPHADCQRHANLACQDRQHQCPCIGQAGIPSTFYENVTDLASSIAQVMVICELHECKAKCSIDIMTYNFLHYDTICFGEDKPPKLKLRKAEIFSDLCKKCMMNRVESYLAYQIMKRGFKAFYYKSKQTLHPDCPPKYKPQCIWAHASKRTAETYAAYEGLSCQDAMDLCAKIKVIYKKFLERMTARLKSSVLDAKCVCCYCNKQREREERKKICEKSRKPPQCPHCCKKAPPKPKPKRVKKCDKCSVCLLLLKCCKCKKTEFELAYVKSIWDREDFDMYYQMQIEETRKRDEMEKRCPDKKAEENGIKKVSKESSLIRNKSTSSHASNAGIQKTTKVSTGKADDIPAETAEVANPTEVAEPADVVEPAENAEDA